MDEYIKFDDAIKAMDELEEEDIESYGCKCAECFDGERARLAICLLPRWKATGQKWRPETIGHWEWVQYDSNPNIGNWHCSECRTIIPHMPEETDNTPIYKWCPMCGAKMHMSAE